MTKKIPWLAVYGFGAHIKSTQKKLIILDKGITQEYPLDELGHLLIVGGHTLTSTTISHLIKAGSCVSFFEPDGTPVGTIRPFMENPDMRIHRLQENLPRHRYATMIAQAAIRSRLMRLESIQEKNGSPLFYQGESQILYKSYDELVYLVKLDEIRRLYELTTDMYYEILSRNLPESLHFKRRTVRPQCDPVNAMFSFGYAMLYGNYYVSVFGAGLDPDIGILSEGRSALIHDLCSPVKAEMIDPVVCAMAREQIHEGDYEETPVRCMLSDSVIKNLIAAFKKTIDSEKIDRQIHNFLLSLDNADEFKVMY
ncbi:MAG: CRISPR-associated endonuclease Cas1 [Methanoregula sp.]|jgi:CRISPR-associated endonuclease Cas1